MRRQKARARLNMPPAWSMALAASLVPAGGYSQALEPVDLQLLAVDDSASYLVYSYSAHNPAASSWSISGILVDVAAASGTPPALPATGEFVNLSAAHASEPYARIGPITPTGWLAILGRDAWLVWAGPEDGVFATDSIPPGADLIGFGLRSTYLPAIREVRAEPTWQSCCASPLPGTLENPRTSQFAVSSYGVIPGYPPEDLTIDLVQNQLDAICSDPLWLRDGALCSEFGSLVFDALSSLTAGDASTAADKLVALSERIDEERTQMEPEAFWILYHNVRQAHRNVVHP